MPGRGGADQAALRRVRAAADADAGLVDQRTAGTAAIRALERTALRQFVEIAPRCLGRHVEHFGERRDAHGSLAPQQRQQLRVALVLAQSLLAPSHAQAASISVAVPGVGGEIEERVAIAQESGIAHGRRVERWRQADLVRRGRAARASQDRRDPFRGNHRATHAGTNVIPVDPPVRARAAIRAFGESCASPRTRASTTRRSRRRTGAAVRPRSTGSDCRRGGPPARTSSWMRAIVSVATATCSP